MFLKKIGLAAAGVALAAFGFVATAQATPTNVNVSSPGKGVIATDVAEFDWSSTGSGLSIGVGPFGTPLTVGQQFAFKYQALLAGFVTNNAIASGLVTSANGGAFAAGQYQYTAVATFREVVTSISGGPLPGTPVTANFGVANQTGTFSIFYDDSTTSGKKANVATGTGFDDGIEVARFTIVSAFTTFTQTTKTKGIGAAKADAVLQVAVDFVNPNYIKGLVGKLFGMEFQSTENFPATNSKTTGFHIGGSALYPNTPGHSNDILLKVDGSSTFSSIPEPQTLLLFGMGLLMLGFMARRSTTRAH
jgi:hypothetical protein